MPSPRRRGIAVHVDHLHLEQAHAERLGKHDVKHEQVDEADRDEDDGGFDNAPKFIELYGQAQDRGYR